MSFLARWFARRASLGAGQRERLEAWKRSTPSARDRVVSVDVESSGLDASSDRLIALGAVAIESGTISLGERYYAILRQARASDDENILVHRIGGASQLSGEDPVDALLGFLEFAGSDPLIGFHALFDELMLAGAMRRDLGERPRFRWLDLAWLGPALHPGAKEQSLDEWCARYAIRNALRHHALADAYATAQLFLAFRSAAREIGISGFEAMRKAARAAEWLGRLRSRAG